MPFKGKKSIHPAVQNDSLPTMLLAASYRRPSVQNREVAGRLVVMQHLIVASSPWARDASAATPPLQPVFLLLNLTLISS